MKAYECLYIVHPAAQEVELKESLEKFGKIIADNGGTLKKAEVLGKRRLAYRVNNLTEGSYILIRFEGVNETLKEFEHNLRVDDRVLRYMVTYEIPEGVGYNDELMVLSEKRERPRRGGGGRRRFREDEGGAGGGGGGGRYRRDDRNDRRDSREPSADSGGGSPARTASPEAVPAASSATDGGDE